MYPITLTQLPPFLSNTLPMQPPLSLIQASKQCEAPSD
jgi:hypothetical protein